VVANISGSYECLYLGFGLLYGLPTQFPYPMVVGGSANPDATAANNRYSSTATSHRSFANPYADAAEACDTSIFDTTNDYATLKVLQGTSWIKIRSKVGSDIYGVNHNWPYFCSETASYSQFNTLRENVDGSYPLFSIVPMISIPNKHIFGSLQGVFAVPGFGGVAAEDVITIGADTYIVFPIIPNASATDFWALLLE